MEKPNILVLCTGNSARSQIAEALSRKHGGDRFNVYSAGTDPKGMNPYTVRSMNEIGIDVSAQWSKHLKEYLGVLPVKYLITVCGNADENCPVWPGNTQRLHWLFEDPAACSGSDEEKLKKFREIRNQIEARVKSWLENNP